MLSCHLLGTRTSTAKHKKVVHSFTCEFRKEFFYLLFTHERRATLIICDADRLKRGQKL
jgi:hypothetical protein